jgi:glycosyltransferase involved in cell wall biosynthesis
MKRVYSNSRVMLVPSAQETWGLIAVEAALSGIPTIGSPTAGMVESDVCWRLIDRADLDGWNRAINELMTDRATWQEASAHAKEKAAIVMELIEIELESALDQIEDLL